MSTPLDRRSRKRLATRQGISDTATRLFMQRGFDNVTVDEIAAAADVGRMTVFNHFPRKEDLFFDRDEDGRQRVQDALRDRDPDVPPLAALRVLAHRLAEEKGTFLVFTAASQAFVATVEASDSLQARARAIGDEIARTVAAALAESVGRDADDPDARLAAALLVATWRTAFLEGHRTFRVTRSSAQAKAAFLSIVDRGTVGVSAALPDSPYCETARSR